jgi:hypothetical protein
MSAHESFHEVYEDYRAALALALTSRGGKTARAVALEREDMLDAAWDRLSRAVPPLTALGQLCFTRKRIHFFLHAVGRQAVWPEEEGSRRGLLALASLALAAGVGHRLGQGRRLGGGRLEAEAGEEPRQGVPPRPDTSWNHAR